MKPLKLVMRAFGSYAGKETLDFARLGAHGVYLITGETGSGKTTIFDAISFALFGKASGGARNNSRMLRSDYAEHGTSTFVDLEFSSGAEVYRVKREITPRVARKTGEISYTESASLTLSDGTVLTGSREVGAKVLDIVGLDRDQFAQIVMIAQNDFLRFLQSGTDERVKILRRIFGTETLKAFQEDLKTRAKEKETERDSILRDFERYEVSPYRRGEWLAELEEGIKSDGTFIKQADEGLDKIENTREVLTARIAVAQGVRALFSELAALRKAREEHCAKRGEMAAVSGRRRQGEAALRKVKPFADKAGAASAAYAAAIEGLEKAKEAEREAVAAFERAGKTLAELPPLEAKQAAFDELRGEWERAAFKLKRLAGIKGDYDAITGKQGVCAALQAELSAIETTLTTLPSLAEAQSAFEKTRAELSALLEKREALGGLKNSYDAIAATQNRLTAAQAEFETRSSLHKSAKAEYDALYEHFLRGQAGVLAQSLQSGKPCPVCGAAEHPSPAALPDEDVSESGLKKLNAELDAAKSTLDDKTADCAALRAELHALSERFAGDAAQWFAETPLDTTGSLLAAVINQTAQSISAMTAEKEADEIALSDLAEKTEKLNRRREELNPRCAAAQAEIDTLTDRCLKDFREYAPDTVWNTAGDKLAAMLAEIKVAADDLTIKKNADEAALSELKINRENAAKLHTDSKTTLSSASTLAAERAKRETEQRELSGAANEAYREALAVNGFDGGEADYAASLITEEELAAMTNLIFDYEENGKQIDRDIARLESETAGKEAPDLDKMNAEAAELKESSDVLRAEREEKKLRLDNNSRILKELKKAAEALVKIEKDYAALKGLSDTASGKLDFETYAQMAYFEHILRAANMRLKVMSQHRYALFRKEETDDGRKRMGLEIEVSDSYTGKSRSANSLSGGESFMASLALALGLSDAVQQRAGGVRLDAMFIDEGFGSLDAEVLELAVRTLSDIAGGSRIVGIISHVAELRERIDKQIRVEKTAGGSKISMAV